MWRDGDDDPFVAFDLDRVELGAAWLDDDGVFGLVAQLDVVRSAAPDSLVGVDGNALVAKLARAYGQAGWRHEGVARGRYRLGLIPDVWVESLEYDYDLRAVAPTLTERAELTPRNELGLSLDYAFLDERLVVRLAVTNGDGGSQVELDRRKTFTGLLRAVPLSFEVAGEFAHVGVQAGYRDGTRGVGEVRDDRFLAALTLSHPRFSAGVEGAYGWGYRDRGDRETRAIGAWLAGEPLARWLGVYARYDDVVADVDVDDSALTRIEAGLYTDFGRPVAGPLSRLRLFVGWRGERFGAAAGSTAGAPELDDSDTFVIALEARASTPPSP